MADVVAANMTGTGRSFVGFDLSTKLKLMGVDVASFGDAFAEACGARPLTYADPFRGVYKKLLFNADGTRLLGGVLVGDASEYGALLGLFKSCEPLPLPPGELLTSLAAGRTGGLGGDAVRTLRCALAIASVRARSAKRSAKRLTTVAQVKA